MLNSNLQQHLEQLISRYRSLTRHQHQALYEISMSEIADMVYNSNAIENSSLTLRETEDIILRGIVARDQELREVYEAKNLANIMSELYKNPHQRLSTVLILSLHRLLMDGVDDHIAGRWRGGKEWVRVGSHLGANPAFVAQLMSTLVDEYNLDDQRYFVDKIAYFHAEFESIHPFNDGNGRIGRVIINQQLIAHGLPPIVIRNKSKNTDYYPLLERYEVHGDTGGLSALVALSLMEAIHKRLAILGPAPIVNLSKWARQSGLSGSSAANKAKRQTIPAFRINGVWKISADYNGS